MCAPRSIREFPRAVIKGAARRPAAGATEQSQTSPCATRRLHRPSRRRAQCSTIGSPMLKSDAGRFREKSAPLVERAYAGGSDARTIMGTDQAGLPRLWGEKRGEAAPADLSGNLIVRSGSRYPDPRRETRFRSLNHARPFPAERPACQSPFDGFRRRTPSSMNSIPAPSNACRKTLNVDRRGSLVPDSKCRIVTTPTLA
jgi:hypothetical protein